VGKIRDPMARIAGVLVAVLALACGERVQRPADLSEPVRGETRPLGGYDPEFSPDGSEVVFSHVNEDYDNFGMGAQDLWVGRTDGSGVRPLHPPTGTLRMIPDWQDDLVLFTEYDEFGQYLGLATMHPDGTHVVRLDTGLRDPWDGGRHGKFIPPLDPDWPHPSLTNRREGEGHPSE
jgi:hypothetical protein